MFTSTLRGRRLVIPISLTLKRLHQQQPRPAEPPARAKRPERPVAGLFCKLVEAPVCPALPWKKPRLRGAPPAPPPLSSASLCRLRFSEPASGTRRPPSQITLHTALRRKCCCRPFAGRDQPGGDGPRCWPWETWGSQQAQHPLDPGQARKLSSPGGTRCPPGVPALGQPRARGRHRRCALRRVSGASAWEATVGLSTRRRNPLCNF